MKNVLGTVLALAMIFSVAAPSSASKMTNQKGLHRCPPGQMMVKGYTNPKSEKRVKGYCRAKVHM